MKPLVLDAMGVMYKSGDDLGELLIPFLTSKGINDRSQIESLYHDASLGKCISSEFWNSLNISPTVEDDYLSMHSLVPGLSDFLISAKEKVSSTWYLSNDVLEWSMNIRKYFEIDHYFEGFIISGDVGIRKSDEGIYEKFLDTSKNEPDECIFVDDREKAWTQKKPLGFKQ